MQKWNNKVMFPRDNYILRVTDEHFGPSKGKDNPMITLEYEIVSPESVNVAGQDYLVVGTKLKGYYTTIVLNGDGDLEEKTKSCFKMVFKSDDKDRPSLYELFGLPTDNANPENPVLAFKGKLVHALLYPDETVQRKTPTAEQLKKGEQGDVLCNPLTKQPLIQFYPKIGQIFGLAAEDASKPY